MKEVSSRNNLFTNEKDLEKKIIRVDEDKIFVTSDDYKINLFEFCNGELKFVRFLLYHDSLIKDFDYFDDMVFFLYNI
jgi:hypothetical protein